MCTFISRRQATRASWLNQVEVWFSILQGQSLSGASFTSLQQLQQHSRRVLRAAVAAVFSKSGQSCEETIRHGFKAGRPFWKLTSGHCPIRHVRFVLAISVCAMMIAGI
jgi:hypothetical protein